jgi:hypothetical protein
MGAEHAGEEAVADVVLEAVAVEGRVVRVVSGAGRRPDVHHPCPRGASDHRTDAVGADDNPGAGGERSPVRSVADHSVDPTGGVASKSRTCRRGAISRSTPARHFTVLSTASSPTWNDTRRTGGAPLASTPSSNPQRPSWTTPPREIA